MKRTTWRDRNCANGKPASLRAEYDIVTCSEKGCGCFDKALVPFGLVSLKAAAAAVCGECRRGDAPTPPSPGRTDLWHDDGIHCSAEAIWKLTAANRREDQRP